MQISEISNYDKIENHLLDPSLIPEKFEFDHFIAKGAFGSVNQYIYGKNPNQIYAIKVCEVPPDNEKDQKLKEINKELSNLARIHAIEPKPDSILRYHGYFKEFEPKNKKETYYIVFDLHPRSLKSLIKDHQKMKKPIEFSLLRSLYKEFLLGMTCMQAIKMGHRDLKPDNLLLDAQNHLKIIDFGIAEDIQKQIINMKVDLSLTNVADISNFKMTLAGNKAYASPEVFEAFMKGLEDHNWNAYKSDVFAFGLILLELGSLKYIKRLDEGDTKLELDIQEGINIVEEVYSGLKGEDLKDFKEILNFMKICLTKNVKQRPDFLDLFKVSCISNRNNEKLLYHIKLEEMSISEIEKIFKKNICKKKKEPFEKETVKMKKQFEEQLKEKDQKNVILSQKIDNMMKEIKNLQEEKLKFPKQLSLKTQKEDEEEQKTQVTLINDLQIKMIEVGDFSDLKYLNRNDTRWIKISQNEENWRNLNNNITAISTIIEFKHLKILEVNLQFRTFIKKKDLQNFITTIGEIANLEKLELKLSNKCIDSWPAIDDTSFLGLIREVSKMKDLHTFFLDMEINSITLNGVQKSIELFKNGFNKLRLLNFHIGRQFEKSLKEFEIGKNYFPNNYLMKMIFKEIIIPNKYIEEIQAIVLSKNQNENL